jgi:hypothetical protein
MDNYLWLVDFPRGALSLSAFEAENCLNMIFRIKKIGRIFSFPSLRAAGEAIQKWLIVRQIRPLFKKMDCFGQALAMTRGRFRHCVPQVIVICLMLVNFPRGALCLSALVAANCLNLDL